MGNVRNCDTVAIGVAITTETWAMLGVSRIELVHQALGVRLDPALYSFARLHSEDFYPRRRNKPTAGGFAHELALVRSSIRPTYDYPVALCDDILHRCDEVREGRAVGDYTPAIVVGTLYREIQRVMADEFIRQESFDLNNVTVVPAILEKATDGGFVVLFGHH